MLPARSLSPRGAPHPYVEKMRSRFYDLIDRPQTATFLEYLAVCQTWTGRTRRGQGVMEFNRRVIPIQEFAYELYYSPIPPRDPATGQAVKLVARCVAAGTPNCVHQNHLGLVRSGTPACPPLPLEQRQAARWRFHTDGVDLMAVEPRGKMATARIARIVLRMEGPDDPILSCEQPVDKDG